MKKPLLILAMICLPLGLYIAIYGRNFMPTKREIIGGCFDTSDVYGWPYVFYKTAGVTLNCGGGEAIESNFSLYDFAASLIIVFNLILLLVAICLAAFIAIKKITLMKSSIN